MILSDTDILNFNHQLKDDNFFIKAEYTNFSSYPVIAYYSILNTNNFNFCHDRISEPVIEYQLIFSVCEKRLDEFFEIFNKITKYGIENHVYYSSLEHKQIKLSETIIHSKSELQHTFMSRNYKKIKYNFKGKVSSIIAYVQALKDTIEYFGMIFGYTEQGEEICLLKYPIGSIVSPVTDKSKDVLVVDYKYNKSTNSKFTIDYEVYEVISNQKLSIIQYGEKSILKENQLGLSRTAQVNSILN